MTDLSRISDTMPDSPNTAGEPKPGVVGLYGIRVNRCETDPAQVPLESSRALHNFRLAFSSPVIYSVVL